ncbi:polyprenyl synthetase family protein [Desulfonatronum thioautotrophicum]|uniref:polyprenyl synthetase family protein n=1 Tax=Desulfonatronum thioautotrophicum TaxID=617001 RepID=UPI0005EB1F32|nr:farnesyl diphosphate synthase [Desulfonatronum thioautotrophicum]
MKAYLAELGSKVDSYLATCLQRPDVPEQLLQAMEYSLLAGGKRLRPVLCLVWAEMVGEDQSHVLPAAAALECIHTYSLIHDDLPPMDDDDLRRGKPANHKRFGEAMAILAGDALLTEAFGLFMRCNVPPERVLTAGLELVQAAGASGMVGGQVLDMQWTGGTVDVKDLSRMQELKTGAMIRASCVCGAILGGANTGDIGRAAAYGMHIGRAFQITDDILDVTGDQEILGKPVGSDQGLGKVTYPALIGLEGSRNLARSHTDQALASLDAFAGPEDQTRFLRELAEYILVRAT